MKKILILMLIILSLTSFAQDEEQEIDYTDETYLNDLSPQDLSQAIQEGKITDFSKIDNENLAEALQSRPALIDRDNVFSEVSKRVETSPDFLNTRRDAKKKWFSRFDIDDEGAEIESFDGDIIVTKGQDSTTFNINDHPGATVLDSGKLILASGAEIASGTVSVEEGVTDVQNGNVDLTNAPETEISVTNGNVKIDDRLYSGATDEKLSVTKKAGITEVSGVIVVETDEAGQTTFQFTGTVRTYPDDHKEFDEGAYTLFENGEESRSYSVTETTQYYAIAEGCDGSTSCIEEDQGNVRIVAKDNNNILATLSDNSINNLVIDKIDDQSRIIFNDKNKVELTFSRSPISYEGDLTDLRTPIRTTFAVGSTVIDESIIDGRIIISGDEIGNAYTSKNTIYKSTYFGHAGIETGFIVSGDPYITHEDNLPSEGGPIFFVENSFRFIEVIENSRKGEGISVSRREQRTDHFRSTEISSVDLPDITTTETVIVPVPVFETRVSEGSTTANALYQASVYRRARVRGETIDSTSSRSSSLNDNLNRNYFASENILSTASLIESYETLDIREEDITIDQKNDKFYNGIKIIGPVPSDVAEETVYVRVTFGTTPELIRAEQQALLEEIRPREEALAKVAEKETELTERAGSIN